MLEYEIQQSDVDLWGTLSDIIDNISVDGNKLLSISIDPLIDFTVLRPEEAYEITNL
jgi:hypothetical protein